MIRTLAIGDIHGCHTALVNLLAAIQLQSTDRLIFLGGYIDRGPASRQVVETVMALRKSCSTVFLRGNHEVMILDARQDSLKDNLWQGYGGDETLVSYGASFRNDWAHFIPVSHWEFFESTVGFCETETHIFVHASLDPDLDMGEQPEWLLYWEFFERLRPHKSGKRIICGHSPQRSGQINDVGFAVCIDTAAVRGGWLTCLDVHSGQFWQASENGSNREGTINPER